MSEKLTEMWKILWHRLAELFHKVPQNTKANVLKTSQNIWQGADFYQCYNKLSSLYQNGGKSLFSILI